MAENSKIQWTTHTFNHIRGCTKVSAGCANCYAETLSKRNPGTLGVWGPRGARVVASETMWREPLKWNKAAACDCHARLDLHERHLSSCPQANRPRVFCASLADVFEDWKGPMVDSDNIELCICNECGKFMHYNQHECTVGCQNERVPRRLTMNDVRARLFSLIDATPNLDWLLLTKRPENIENIITHIQSNGGTYPPEPWAFCGEWRLGNAPPNVWLGTSVENQETADERIPHLLKVPAAVRFLSVEPLLGPIILHKHFARCKCGHGHGFTSCPNYGGVAKECHKCDCVSLRPKIDWVIVGGESGPGARPCNVELVRSIIKQCQAAGVAVFVKQLSGFGL